MIFCFELVFICPPSPQLVLFSWAHLYGILRILSVDLQQNKLSSTQGWVGEILSLALFVKIDPKKISLTSLSSHLCLNGWPILERKLSSDQQHSAICVVTHRREWGSAEGGGGLKSGLKGLSHEVDFDNIDKNWRMLAIISAAAGFWIFRRRLWFLVEMKHSLSGKC